jgi:hypothetical protein
MINHAENLPHNVESDLIVKLAHLKSLIAIGKSDIPLN